MELFAPPAPVAPAGGVPVGRAPVPLPGTCTGALKPCFFRHSSTAVRVAVDPLLDEADADVEVVLVELLPHAASARLVAIAPSAGVSRRARRRVLFLEFMTGPFLVC